MVATAACLSPSTTARSRDVVEILLWPRSLDTTETGTPSLSKLVAKMNLKRWAQRRFSSAFSTQSRVVSSSVTMSAVPDQMTTSDWVGVAGFGLALLLGIVKFWELLAPTQV